MDKRSQVLIKQLRNLLINMSRIQCLSGPYLPTPQSSKDDVIANRKARKQVSAESSAMSWLSTPCVAEPVDELNEVSEHETLHLTDVNLPNQAALTRLQHASPRSSTISADSIKSRKRLCSIKSSAHNSAEHNSPSRTLKLHYCPLCRRKAFKSANDLERHMKTVHDFHKEGDIGWQCQEVECKTANKIWPRRDNFKQHLIRVHGQWSVVQLDLSQVLYHKKTTVQSPQDAARAASAVDIEPRVDGPVLQSHADLCSLGCVFQTQHSQSARDQNIDLDNVEASTIEPGVFQSRTVGEPQPISYSQSLHSDHSCILNDLVPDDECLSQSQVADDDSVETLPDLTISQERYASNLADITTRMLTCCINSNSRGSLLSPSQLSGRPFTQHGPSNINHNKRPASSTQDTSHKRPRQLGSISHSTSNNFTNDDSADDGDGNRDEAGPVANVNVPINVNKTFACPYRKYDPVTYGQRPYRICATGKWENISTLKQHLRRCHEEPEFYCAKCYQKFDKVKDKDENKLQRDRHVRACETNRPCPWTDKMTLKQAEDIHRKHRAPNTDMVKWYEIFKILFPRSTKPSSPYNTSEDEDRIRTVHSFFIILRQIATQVYEHIQASGPDIFPEPLTPEIINRAYELFQERMPDLPSGYSGDAHLPDPGPGLDSVVTTSRPTQSDQWKTSGHRDSGIGTEIISVVTSTTRTVQTPSTSPHGQHMRQPQTAIEPPLLSTTQSDTDHAPVDEDVFANFIQQAMIDIPYAMNTYDVMDPCGMMNRPSDNTAAQDARDSLVNTFADPSIIQNAMFQDVSLSGINDEATHAAVNQSQIPHIVDPSRLSTDSAQPCPGEALQALRNVNRYFPYNGST